MALVNESKHKTLVFVGKKVRCDDLVKYLYSKQVNALQLHGDMS
jgi:superfamily II DNA/RNA helicase